LKARCKEQEASSLISAADTFSTLARHCLLKFGPSLRKIQKAAWRTRPCRLYQHALPMMSSVSIERFFFMNDSPNLVFKTDVVNPELITPLQG
jgi:hypothetical protein